MKHWILFSTAIIICGSMELSKSHSLFQLAQHVEKLEIYPRSLWIIDDNNPEELPFVSTPKIVPILPIHFLGSGQTVNLSALSDSSLVIFGSCHPFKDLHPDLFIQFPLVILDECKLHQIEQWSLNLESRVFTIMGPERTLTEIYKIGNNILVVNPIGTYDPVTGFLLNEPSIWIRRSNLQGHEFKIGHHNGNPLTFTTNPDGTYGGFLGQVLDLLQASLNFTCQLIPDPTGRYGTLVDGNNFDGMVGMIQSGKVDIGLSELSFTQERLQVIELLEPCWYTTFEFLFKRPSASIQWTTYTQGYDIAFWTAYFLMALILMSAYLGMAKYWNIPFNDLMGHFFGSLFNREIATIDQKPMMLSLRILLFSSLCFSFIVLATYSAVLTSFLATREISIPLKRFEDFLKPEHKLALKSGTAVYDMFRYAKEGSIFREVFDRKIKPDPRATYETNPYASEKDGSNVSRLLDLGYYLILDRKYYSLTTEDPCQNIFVPIPKFIIDFSSLGMTKDSPFKNLFDFHLRMQRDSGVWRTLMQRAFIGKPDPLVNGDCDSQHKDDNNGLEFEIVLPAFSICGCGMLISFGILIIERVSLK